MFVNCHRSYYIRRSFKPYKRILIMKRNTFILVLCLLACCRQAGAQAPNFLWASGINTSNATGVVTTRAVTTDGAGNVYVTGSFSDTADFDPGPGVVNLVSQGTYDVFVCKYSPGGAYVWARSFGGTGDDFAESIAVDGTGNVYVNGNFIGTSDFDPGTGIANLTATPGEYDVFVCKLNSLGAYAWAQSAGGKYRDYARGIAVDAAGNVFSAGNFGDTVDFDPGSGVAKLASAAGATFIWKLDATGAYVWAKQMGGQGGQADAIALDAKGNIYTTGNFIGLTADFDPGPGTANLASYSGTYLSPGIFVSKLDASGSYLWAKAMIGTSPGPGKSALGYDIAVDRHGNVYTSGAYMKTVDFDPGSGVANITSSNSLTYDAFISKLDSNGAYVWAKGVGSNNYATFGYGIALDDSSNAYLTGNFGGTVDFDPGSGTAFLSSVGGVGYDIYVLKLDAGGSYKWAKSMGSANGEFGYGIAVDHVGGIYVAGTYKGTVDFDPGSAVNNLFAVAQSGYVFKWADSVAAIPGLAVSNTTVRNGVSIAPQPASNTLIIRCSDAAMRGREVVVYSMQGAVVTRCRLEASSSIDVSTWAPGVYSLRLPDGGALRIVKR